MHSWEEKEDVWRLKSPFPTIDFYYRLRLEEEDGEDVWVSDDDIEVGEPGLVFKTLEEGKEAAEKAWEVCREGINSWDEEGEW